MPVCEQDTGWGGGQRRDRRPNQFGFEVRGHKVGGGLSDSRPSVMPADIFLDIGTRPSGAPLLLAGAERRLRLADRLAAAIRVNRSG